METGKNHLFRGINKCIVCTKRTKFTNSIKRDQTQKMYESYLIKTNIAIDFGQTMKMKK